MLVGELMATLSIDDSAFHASIERAKSSFSGLSSYATTQGRAVGANFARGIASGISANTGVIQAAARAAATAAAAAARAALQINSPSRVGAEIGKFFGMGLAGGIRSMQNSVSAAANNLANAASIRKIDAQTTTVNHHYSATEPAPSVLVLDGKVVAQTMTEDNNQALGLRARQLAMGYGK